MKKHFLITLFTALVVVSACKKNKPSSPSADLTANFIGTYTDTIPNDTAIIVITRATTTDYNTTINFNLLRKRTRTIRGLPIYTSTSTTFNGYSVISASEFQWEKNQTSSGGPIHIYKINGKLTGNSLEIKEYDNNVLEEHTTLIKK